MRRLAAILLLGTMLFNLVGYRVLFHYWSKQSDQKLEAGIDRHQYKETDLITLRVPLNMPYVSDESNYQRVDGSVTINGIDYQYVQRRIYHDTLFLMCLPNQEKTELSKAYSNYESAVNDLQKPGQKQTGQAEAFMKLSLAKYAVPENSWRINPISTIEPIYILLSDPNCFYNLPDCIEHPPRPGYMI